MRFKYNPWVSLVAMLLAVIILVLTCTGCTTAGAAGTETRFVVEHRENCRPYGELYIITDTETGAQYLAWDTAYGGGITEMLPGEG